MRCHSSKFPLLIRFFKIHNLQLLVYWSSIFCWLQTKLGIFIECLPSRYNRIWEEKNFLERNISHVKIICQCNEENVNFRNCYILTHWHQDVVISIFRQFIQYCELSERDMPNAFTANCIIVLHFRYTCMVWKFIHEG